MKKIRLLLLLSWIPFLFGSFKTSSQIGAEMIGTNNLACGPIHYAENQGPAGCKINELRYDQTIINMNLTPGNRVYLGNGFGGGAITLMVRMAGVFNRISVINETYGYVVAYLDYDPNAPLQKYYFSVSFSCFEQYNVLVE